VVPGDGRPVVDGAPSQREPIRGSHTGEREELGVGADHVQAAYLDGVLNAVRRDWSAPARHATASTGGLTYRMCCAPDLLDRLRAWHRDGRVELRWATTWCRDADQLEPLWDLPPLARAMDDDDLGSQGRIVAAKLRAGVRVTASPGR
jgi:hypothetical protein